MSDVAIENTTVARRYFIVWVLEETGWITLGLHV
jgi:hypothetical protein